MVRFFARAAAGAHGSADPLGPFTVAETRELLHQGVLTPAHELCREGGLVWAPLPAWTELNVAAEPPARHLPQRPDATGRWTEAFLSEGRHLRWWLRLEERDRGPADGEAIRRWLAGRADLPGAEERTTADGRLAGGWIALVGGPCWMPLEDLRQAVQLGGDATAQADSAPTAATGSEGVDLHDGAAFPRGSGRLDAASPPPPAVGMARGTPSVGPVSDLSRPAFVEGRTICCAICLERIPAASPLCPECGEPPVMPNSSVAPAAAATSMAPRSMAPSIADDPPDAGWLRLHWRPLITMGVIGTVIATGIALRHLAPDRYKPPKHISPPPAAAVCDNPCWHGEACQVGRCVWQPPNDVGHVHAEPVFSGPFSLPPDVVDVLPIDGERFAASSLKGVVIYSARTGELMSLVSDAPQAQRLVPVGSVLYATSPRRIYVIDAETTRVLKTIEVGSQVHDIAVGAGGRQALASVPSLRAVLVIGTDYHAEVNRFYFGDDAVGPVGLDDAGKRALATTGRTPLPGLRGPQGGALYAFDPSRLASEQDRVRAAMVGNPADLVMIPDDQSSFVVLREQDRIVPLRRLLSGAVRRDAPLETCEQPEQIELIRRGRRAIVRCNQGRTIEIFDLDQRKLVRHIPLNARAADMVVSPDHRQALIAMPHDGAGALGLLDLKSYELSLNELSDEPHQVRMTADGRTAVVVSERSKVAWVVR